MIKIIVAETAGFCFGVNRAVNTVYECVNNGLKIYTLGPIIHNKQVVEDLKSKGVQAVDSISDIREKNTKVVIRTHGVPKDVYSQLEENNLDYIDTTCPYVKKIHKIVEKHYHEGYQIVIIGSQDHPEVLGINGWCNNSAIVISEMNDDIKKRLSGYDKFCIVAQTTINRLMWEDITRYFTDTFSDVLIFDTICNATNLRQTEAERISKIVDIMLVIGGKHSSNTQKLVQICLNNCKNTYHIETFEDIPDYVDFSNKKVGITAGASTPAWIIKEVINKMTEKENLQEKKADMDFAELFEQSMVTLNTGDIVKGTVIGVSNTEVYVDLGFKSDGVITLDELTNDPSLSPKDIVKVGDEIEVFVIRVNDGEGNVLLSKKKLDLIKGWEHIEAAFENQKNIKGKVIQVTHGGVIVLAEGIKIFVPASQASDRFLTDLNVLLYSDVSLKIIDINQRKKRVVGSIRKAIEEEKELKAEALWKNIEIGKRYSGVVKKITDFGAFVDIGGVDGLIHISELSWSKIKHPSEVLKEGDIAEVYVIDFDKEKNKISLGFKKAEDNPWEIAKNRFHVGDVVKCKVVRLVPFGAFVELLPGLDGLIHISQIANKRIGKPEDVLSIGQEVEAKIIEMDLENNKISLSIRELLNHSADNSGDEPEEDKKVDDSENNENTVPAENTEDTVVTIADIVNEKNENK